MAAVGLKALLGQETPAFVVAPALTVTKENVAQGWKDSLNREAPQSVLDAAK
jgi:ribose transport system substrate-binding protein